MVNAAFSMRSILPHTFDEIRARILPLEKETEGLLSEIIQGDPA